MEPLSMLVYAALGFIGYAGVIMGVEAVRGRGQGGERLRSLAAELESERLRRKGCEEKLSVLSGKVEVLEKQVELLRRDREDLEKKLREREQRIEELRRELNHLAKENKAALNLYEALSKGKVRITDNEGNECRVLVDGSIICKDRLVYPEVG